MEYKSTLNQYYIGLTPILVLGCKAKNNSFIENKEYIANAEDKLPNGSFTNYKVIDENGKAFFLQIKHLLDIFEIREGRRV